MATQALIQAYIDTYLARCTDEQLLHLVRTRVFPRLTLAQKLLLLAALRQEVGQS